MKAVRPTCRYASAPRVCLTSSGPEALVRSGHDGHVPRGALARLLLVARGNVHSGAARRGECARQLALVACY